MLTVCRFYKYTHAHCLQILQVHSCSLFADSTSTLMLTVCRFYKHTHAQCLQILQVHSCSLFADSTSTLMLTVCRFYKYSRVYFSDTTNVQTQCEDKLPDCKDYGQQACTGIYEPWAHDNCAKYCNFCPNTSRE